MDNLKQMRRRAQSLRKNMTKEESLLWYQFLRDYPMTFKRQYVIGNYIVDFYCWKAKLIVELDGSQHCEPEIMRYDEARSAFFAGEGFYVLRISNLDVLEHFREVCDHIDWIACERYREFGGN